MKMDGDYPRYRRRQVLRVGDEIGSYWPKATSRRSHRRSASLIG